MVTIKDVALVAGVTVTTVSRVLNNKDHISEKTKKKVYDAIKQLNYQPNEMARSLLKRKSSLIGVIVPDIKHQYYAELVSYIEYYANENGYKLLLCNSYKDTRMEKSYIEMLKRNQVAGIIMAGHSLKIHEYLNLNLPLVAIDRYLSETIPCISSDNYEGGFLATNHLIDKGCTKLAHISGPVVLNTPVNKRREAFIDVVTNRKVNYAITETKLNTFSIDDYVEVICNLFNKYPDIDGVFASNDMIAAVIIKLMERLKKEIPTNLKVVGYDDICIANLLRPALTTIKQPIKQIGQKAVEILANQLEGVAVEAETILPVALVERETT